MTERKTILPLGASPANMGMPSTRSQVQDVDLRPYVEANPDVGADDIGLSEQSFQDLLYAISEFFNPEREVKTYFVVGKELIKVPGNLVVMTSHSALVAGMERRNLQLCPDMSITASPKAFVTAWLFINGITPNPNAPWTYGFEAKDHAWLYFWLRALQVDLLRIELIAEWMTFPYDVGTRIDTETYTPNETGRSIGVTNVSQVDNMSLDELNSRIVNRPGAFFLPMGVDPNSVDSVRDYAKRILFTKNRTSRLEYTGKKEDLPLLTRMYEDLLPSCKQIIDNKFEPPFDQYSAVCQGIDDLGDLIGKPRINFRDIDMKVQQDKENAWREAEFQRTGQYTYERMPTNRIPEHAVILKEGKEGTLNIVPGSAPDLTAYAVYSTIPNEAIVAQATLLALIPDEASKYLFELRVGRENAKVYGDPLVMSVYSETMSRLYQSRRAGEDYPQLASHLSIGASPRAFVKVWLYINGITSDTENALASTNMSLQERLQMWDWFNYFDVPLSNVMGWLKPLGEDAERIKDKLAEDGKTKLIENYRDKLSLIHSRLSPRCRGERKRGHASGTPFGLCEGIDSIAKALGIYVPREPTVGRSLVEGNRAGSSSSAQRLEELEREASQSFGMPMGFQSMPGSDLKYVGGSPTTSLGAAASTDLPTEESVAASAEVRSQPTYPFSRSSPSASASVTSVPPLLSRSSPSAGSIPPLL